MGRLLRCSVVAGLAGLIFAAEAVTAGETLTAYSNKALEKLAGKNLVVRDQPQLVNSTPSTEARQQTLVLNCEKIEQAQRSLDEALKKGAVSMPVAAAISGKALDGAIATAPASGAEVYHITQNQRRMDALAQKFNCDVR